MEAPEVRRPGVTGTVRHEVVDTAALLEPPEDPLEAAIREWLTGIREEERTVAGLPEVPHVPIEETRSDWIESDHSGPPLALTRDATDDEAFAAPVDVVDRELPGLIQPGPQPSIMATIAWSRAPFWASPARAESW